MRIIDSDGHFHEPHYLFEEYMEKNDWGKRPRVLKIQGHSMEDGVGSWRERLGREFPCPSTRDSLENGWFLFRHR
jgi:hypothetical protein